MRALVVDDSSVIRKVVSGMMESLGFDVSTAADGRDALEQLEKDGAPELILADWNMPVMDGYELLLAIRANEAWADTKVMMVTTNNDFDHLKRALDAGADEYLMKPFSEEAVREKLILLGLVADG